MTTNEIVQLTLTLTRIHYENAHLGFYAGRGNSFSLLGPYDAVANISESKTSTAKFGNKVGGTRSMAMKLTMVEVANSSKRLSFFLPLIQHAPNS